MSIVSEDFKRPFTKPTGKRGFRDRFRERGPLMPNEVDPVRELGAMNATASEPGMTARNIKGGGGDGSHLGRAGSNPVGGGKLSKKRGKLRNFAKK